jgi:hypothetical protein
MIIGKGAGINDSSFYFYSYRSANNINDFVILGNGTRSDYSLGDNLVPNEWYDVLFSANGTSFTVYIDGRPAGSWITTSAFSGNSNDLNIGDCSCGGYFFNGSLAFVRIYNQPLGASVASYNFANPQEPFTHGLVMWLQANSTSSKSLFDLSKSGNNGFMEGSLSVGPPRNTFVTINVLATTSSGSEYLASRSVYLG